MGNQHSLHTNVDTVEYNLYPPINSKSFPRFADLIPAGVDDRLLFFVAPARFLDELRILDAFLEGKEKEMCMCYWKTLCLQQVEVELQAKLNDASHRTGPLQWRLKQPALQPPCCGYNGWTLAIQMPPGSTMKIQAGMLMRAGSAPDAQVMQHNLAMVNSSMPLHAKVYGQREPTPVQQPLLAPVLRPVWLDASPPPYSEGAAFEASAPSPQAMGVEVLVQPQSHQQPPSVQLQMPLQMQPRYSQSQQPAITMQQLSLPPELEKGEKVDAPPSFAEVWQEKEIEKKFSQ